MMNITRIRTNLTPTSKAKQQTNPLTFTAKNRKDCFQTTQPSSSKINFSSNFFLRLIGIEKKDAKKPVTEKINTPSILKNKLLGSEKTAAKALKKMEMKSKNYADVASKRAMLQQIPILTEVIKETDNNLLKLACYETAQTLYKSYYNANNDDKIKKLIAKTATIEELTGDILNEKELTDKLNLTKTFLTSIKRLQKAVSRTNPLLPERVKNNRHTDHLHHSVNVNITMAKDFAISFLAFSPYKTAEAEFILKKVLPGENSELIKRTSYRTLKTLSKDMEPSETKKYLDFMEANPLKKLPPNNWFSLEQIRRVNQKMIEQGRKK